MKPNLKTQNRRLNTNSTPILQITAASNKHLLNETPKFLKVLSQSPAIPPENTRSGRHPKRFLPNSSPSNDQNDALTTAGASHEESWTFHALPPNHLQWQQYPANGEHHPCPPAITIPPLSSLLTISSPSHADSSLRNLKAQCQNPFEHSISYTDLNTSSDELHELHSVD